jgi:hypothetical protein
MRTKQFTPLKNAGQVLEEIDLTREQPSAADASAFANFMFVPQLALKNIHLPVLTPLVGMDVPGSPPEPVFDSAAQDDIQGNIIPGFNKNHQHFLFLRVCQPKEAKVFLREILPRISTMEEVIAFRRLYRSKRFLLGRHNTYLCSTWVNIGFSHHAIELLAGKADADAFGDRSFQLGLAQRSSYLGDPTSPSHNGSPRRWKVGGPKNEADIVLIVASDHTSVLDDLVDLLKLRANAAALEVIFEQRGDTLSGDLRGHEHFGLRMASPSRACAASSRPRQATTSRRATFQPAIPGACTWPNPDNNLCGRASSSWASNVNRRKIRSTLLPQPQIFRDGRSADRIWLFAGSGRTSRPSMPSCAAARRESA